MGYDVLNDGRSRGSLAVLRHLDEHPDARLLKRLLAHHKCKRAEPEWSDFNARLSDQMDGDTVMCVREYQARSNGKLKVDGVVGPKTWAHLLGVEQLQPSPTKPSRARLLALMGNLPKLAEMRGKGNAATGGEGNACAATASYVLIYLGARTSVETWAETLADETEAAGWERVIAPSQVQRGDLIVCMDGNGNGATDHVWFCMNDAYQNTNGKFMAQCFDNRRDLPIGYPRNLTGRGYTPMKYALRMPK